MDAIEALILGIAGSLIAALVVFLAKQWWDTRTDPAFPSFTKLSLLDNSDAPSASSRRLTLTETLNTFSGRIEILTDELLSHPATPQRIQQFYGGAKLDWDIIAARGDIPRDQHSEFLQQAVQPFKEMRLLCIVAEPGAGKSTSAWHIAAELHQQHKALVMHIKDADDPGVWYRLPEIATKVNRPFYLLVDDIFRDPDAATAFQQLKPWLPITVLATSRRNEYRARRLKCTTLQLELNPPSVNEKESILSELGKSRSDLTAEQQRRFDAANQFLVLMMELTGGKELAEIVRDTLKQLAELDPDAYRAYEYLCFAYQHSITFPVSLLQRIDGKGRFYNLPERETTRGLVFLDSREGHLRAGHSVIAEAAAKIFAEHHSPQILLTDIAKAVDVSLVVERRFLAFLLRALAKQQSSVLAAMPESLENAINHCFLNAQGISELSIWRGFYQYRANQEGIEKCVNLALTLEPRTSEDCNMLLKLCREIGREQDALPKITEWVKNNPGSGGARGAYLGLMERYGDADSIKGVLAETRAWLGEHPDDANVRTAYLKLVERKGTAEQVAQIVNETSDWLAEHPDDVNVRTAYLGLVERKGTAEQVDQIVNETSDWLGGHPDDNYVRTAYLGLVERKGTAEQMARVVKETSRWLGEHTNDVTVRTAYLGLVERKGTVEQIENVLREIEIWLAAHPKDIKVRAAWLNFVEAHGSAQFREATIVSTKQWLMSHSSDKEVWSSLLGWLFREKRTQEAIELTQLALSNHPKDQNLLEHYLRAVQDSEDEDLIKSVSEQLIALFPKQYKARLHYAAWLRDHKYYDKAEQYYKELIAERPGAFSPYYGYGELLLRRERFDEAAAQFRLVLRIHRGHQMAHNGLGLALWKLGQFQEAEREFKKAIYWSSINESPQAIFYTSLGWFYLDRLQLQQALNAFEVAQSEDPDYFGNYWGVGCVMHELGNNSAAVTALQTALEKGEHLEAPASEEIPKLLHLCLELSDETRV